MARLYLETAKYNGAGVKTPTNISVISATTRRLSDSVVIETLSQGDITLDATGRYYASLTGVYINAVVYTNTWTLYFASGPKQTDIRRFAFSPVPGAGSELSKVVLVSKSKRHSIVSREGSGPTILVSRSKRNNMVSRESGVTVLVAQKRKVNL